MARTVVLNEEMKNSLTRGPCAHLWMAAVMLAMTWASEAEASRDQARHRADGQLAVHDLGSDEFKRLLPGRGGSDKSIQVAQATTGDTGALQQPPKQQRDWPESLSCELALARRDIALLQRLEQEHDRAEWLAQDLAAARHDVETQTALATKAGEEASRLKRAGESSAAELEKSLRQERERSVRLEQDLAAERQHVESQAALATKANEDLLQQKQAAEASAADLRQSMRNERDRAETLAQDLSLTRSAIYAYQVQTAPSARASDGSSLLKAAERDGTAELQNSLQQERDRTGQLEQALVAAHRDIDEQAALAARASDEVGRLTRAAKAEAADQKQSIQKEQERADALAQDLSIARSKIYAYEAQAAKASEEAAQLRQTAASNTASLEQAQQQERERAEQLARDFAKASRELDAQTERASKASEDVARIRQARERESTELRSLLQRERERAEELERDLALARRDNGALVGNSPSAAPPPATTGRAVREEPPSAPTRPIQNRPVQDGPVQDKPIPHKSVGARPVPDKAIAARGQSNAQVQSNDSAQAEKLVARASALLEQGDIGSARIVLERAAEMGSAKASFALAETYDPLILPNFGTYGTQGDSTKARDLYARAEAGGIKEAKARYEALRR
ncbi:hypothetical protein [Bradyrhizobium sp. CCBAU 45389]|uniref:hypothetical protein n=1 Tax=Bradyrhizobium sp. CCBAU 45389 TaxID=858429 RepID=UPI0023064B34|nr:hypothetical protein [Bradyrhizobium sp. CCBAU 45389]MDA9397631.1 hypothetical protein [Bradyrhizobium sp. CCBAU 45389]